MKRGNRKVLGQELEYENERFKVRRYDIENFDGEEGTYFTIEKNDAAYVIPFNGKEIYFLKEFRFPANKLQINIPAGGIENGASPEESAHKELEEETGLKAGEMELLGDYVIDPGSQATTTYAFLATKLDESNVGLHNLEPDEDIQEVVKYSIPKVKELILDNKIHCAATLAALNLFFLRLVK